MKLTLEYLGTDFAGWQRQLPRFRTVQQVLEEAIEKMTREKVFVRGAGRTDAGVHAKGQVANFRSTSAIPLIGFLRGLNGTLPPDVSVVSVDEADPAFDALRYAKGKHYTYRIWNREARAPLRASTSWHVYRHLDFEAMKEAARHLAGEHDFTSFRAADCDRRNPVRQMRRIEVSTPEPHLIAIDLESTGFLKHMVRVIAGTLFEVGAGFRRSDEIPTILAARDRTRAGRTAPSSGLTLEKVFY
ncbi:MAG: tRNA pseudouridine(38-40) synthase TruA [Deltaproteobacteria bacterium]|nr:tRNA pseudouridine(38-40) synthase TruA [Deltaproteobacteria bacterium]